MAELGLKARRPSSRAPCTCHPPPSPAAVLTCAAEALLTGLPEPHVEPALEELVIPCLPEVLDSLAPVVPPATAAVAPAEVNALEPARLVQAQRLCHLPGPLAPVAAAQGGEGEGQGEADGEDGQHQLPPGPVHGWRRCAESG